MKPGNLLLGIGLLCSLVANTFPALPPWGQSTVDPFDPDIDGVVHAIALQPDGRILIGGKFRAVGGVPRANLARLLPDGVVDPSFDPGTDQAVHCLALDADGMILVGGAFGTLRGQPRTCLGRLNRDGILDASFGPEPDGTVEALVVQPDGRILVGGEFHTLAGYAPDYLARLNADGSFDTTFQPYPYLTRVVTTIALQTDGRILVGGDDGYGRLDADGTEDTTFLSGANAEELYDVFRLALQPDGKILVAGDFTKLAGQARTNLGRLNPDGSADLAFAPALDRVPGVWGPVLALAMQANGKILAGGHFTIPGEPAQTNLARWHADGHVDPTLSLPVLGGPTAAVRALAVQRDGRILVGGEFTTLGGQPRRSLGRLWPGDDLRLGPASHSGELSVIGTFTNGVCTILSADQVHGPWHPTKHVFTSGQATNLSPPLGASNTFHQALAVELASGSVGFSNLVESYNLLTTIAGAGGATDESNKWLPEFENGPATNALLSGPHIAMADEAGNVFIADKNAHAIRKVRPDGVLVTVAGTNTPGNAPDDPTLATQAGLDGPNGLWVRRDSAVYILDVGNAKVRVLDTNGLLRTLFTVPGGILVGRGLWVSDDESRAFLCSLNTVKQWTAAGGVTDYATNFTELGNLVMDPGGHVVVTDRSAHSVWRLFDDGRRERIAGNGMSGHSEGGGDGGLATLTGLDGVRGVWFLSGGAFFVCTHRGSQVWYVDPGGFIHLFLNGNRAGTHRGDGTWFWAPAELRVSECRAITMDHQGNLLLTEHDAGYVRRVQFLRHQP